MEKRNCTYHQRTIIIHSPTLMKRNGGIHQFAIIMCMVGSEERRKTGLKQDFVSIFLKKKNTRNVFFNMCLLPPEMSMKMSGFAVKTIKSAFA